jgi:hypothetical protein
MTKRKQHLQQPGELLCMKKFLLVLINAGATFQREMDIAFVGEKDRFIVIYLDNMTIFSKDDEDHIKKLREVWFFLESHEISLCH